QALSKIRIKACLENPETSIDNPAPILERSMKSWLKLKFADELRSLNSRTTAEIRNQWSAYLEYSIGTHAELNLSSNEALVLLSLVPELLDNSHGLSDRTISLRQEFSRIARYWQQNALIESARQMAWARSQTPVPDWHQSRYEQLCAWRDSKIQ
ncbi:MAG: hypothetical protein V4692_16235, partial [Bdellovibrionota bacterium]